MKFQVFRNGKIAKDFVPVGVTLFGADRIPFRSSKYITFADGVIDCKTRGSEPAGLCLLWPVEGFGNVMLYTTRLPEREQPYILNVEIVRGKLMEIAMKREDWAIFDQTSELKGKADELQKNFIEVLENINDPAKASLLADKCLTKALLYAEQLAGKYASVLFEARLRSRGFARSSLGCKIDPNKLGDKNYLKGAFELFAHISLPISWAKIEKEKGQYDFTELDQSMNILGRKRLLLCAGPLLNFSPENLPAWMKGRHEFETIREASYEFVSKVVTRYAKYVHVWKVISGLNAQNVFKFSFERILEITRTACLAAREADNRSVKMIDIVLPWGEYYAYDSDTIPPLVYIDMVTQAGINYDALGVQILFGKNEPGMHVRDMMQVSAMLDRFMTLPKQMHITSFAVPDNNKADKQGENIAGVWHKPWDQTVQSKWIEEFCKVAFSKPFVNTVTCSALADSDEKTINGAGLLTDELEPKKSFMSLAKLQRQILQKT
ncbi:MAG: Glycosyl hydrolase family 10 [Planctomycetes bacterium ADurb.Bin401]|nr:MAG: Glycosyl hydrolase family 10 [Planctomycetes bacterium ADurb.Bin401]